MAKQYDLIVIGTGVAASTIAHQCRTADWRVAVIDYQPFGGTCALRGCTPKKVLTHAASVIDALACLQGKGLAPNGAHLQWPTLMDFKRTFTQPTPSQKEHSYAESGIHGYHGKARFTGPRTLQIGDEILESRFIVIAAGAEPAKLPIAGFEYLQTSDVFLELERLPERIILVGGGYIAFEFAHIAARAGAQVTILHRGSRPLERFDPDLVHQLTERTRALGVDIRVAHEVKAVEKGPSEYTVRAESEGQSATFTADLVVHSAGRVPALEDLHLEAAGIEQAGKGVRVNEYLQSVSNPAVYVAGDAVAQTVPLTPVATLEAEVVASNLLQGNQVQPGYRGIPSVLFSVPPLARVGLLESEAQAQGLTFEVHHQNTAGWYTAKHAGEACAGHKILIEKKSQQILGAHLVGPGADEVINLFAVAVRLGLSAADLKRAVYAFPTAAFDIQYML
jgi:glutathione reductase (NADPH)